MDRRAVKSCLIAYVPVIHRGYVELFRRFSASHELYLFDTPLIHLFDYLRKEIRALVPQEAKAALTSLIRRDIGLVGPAHLQGINGAHYHVVMPDEDVCVLTAQHYLRDCEVTFERTFLRWDRTNTTAEQPVHYDRMLPVTELDRELLGYAFTEARKSSDWWRQVGAVLVRDGKPLLVAHNSHVPTEYSPYIDGDPRNAFSKGVNIELGTVLHAEKALICEAARRGIRTEGTYLYTTTFPCPPCAKAVAAAGITRCYYREGYTMLDGERDLRDAGVEVILVPEPASK